MKCTDVRTIIPDFVEARLPALEQAAVEDHLARCPDCRMDAASLERLFQALPRRAAQEPDPAYWGSVLPRIHARLDRPRRSFERVFHPRLAMPILSAALLLMFILSSVPSEFSAPPSVLGEVAESDLAAFVEQQAVVGTEENSSSRSETLAGTDDLPVLKTLLKGETNLSSYIDTEQEILDDALPERDIDQLIPVLEQRFPHSGQLP